MSTAPSRLRSIVYVSSAVHAFSTPQLEGLLLQARALNRQNAITGVLLYNDGNFMQCFEGPDTAVLSTDTRIRASRLHHDIIELMNEPIASRSFGAWKMGLAQPNPSALLALSTARWKRIDSATEGQPDVAPGLELLRIFWRNARRGG